MHVEDHKLFIRGVAPSDEAVTKFWDQINLVDPNAGDLSVEISVEENRSQAASVGGGTSPEVTYQVRSGDTLSKISKEFYGSTDEYMRIFYANRDKLRDPDKIQVGQELVIPPDDNG
jgi:nucleoid-associated protein YgaU